MTATARVERAFPFVIALLGLVVIAPVLWSGWLGDDAFYSALDGMLGADRSTLAQAMRHSFDLWFFGNGRFYPGLIVEKYLVFALFTNLLAYKILLAVATLAVVELFRRCVAAYVTVGAANLAALIAVALLVERGYHDSILAYNAMPQFVALCVLGSLLAFRKTLLGGRASIAAIALYALAALTYEEAYLFALLYAALAKCDGRTWRRALAISWPYLAIGLGLAAFSIAARAVVGVPAASIYASNAAPGPVLATFVNQLVAAFPLSYWLFDPSHIYSRANPRDFYNNAPVQPLVFVAFAAAAAYALARAARETSVPIRAMALCGALVAVFAALPIAFVVKYQHELRPGLGYLPVFYEILGVALIFAAVAIWSARRVPARAVRVGWMVAIAAVATMSQATNVRLVRENQPSRVARAALESQLRAGLLGSAPDGTRIAIEPRFDWIAYDDAGPDGISTRGLFYAGAGRRVDLVRPGAQRAGALLDYDAASGTWRFTMPSPARQPSAPRNR